MEYLWRPWRIEYIKSEKPDGCILCSKPKEDKDEENFILFRGEKNFIMLNAYPYNPGHLMVVPYSHLDTPEKMTEEERTEHYRMVVRCVEVLRKEVGAADFNLGMNLGKVAGAGIDDHIHTHIVPRWNGDTNFITSVSGVRVVPQALIENYQLLKGKF